MLLARPNPMFTLSSKVYMGLFGHHSAILLYFVINYCAASEDAPVNAAQVCTELSSYLSVYPDLAARVGEVLAAMGREGNDFLHQHTDLLLLQHCTC